MWLFPVLSIITALAMTAILVQMFVQGGDNRRALTLSLLSWTVVIGLFFANRWFNSRRPVPEPVTATERPHRVLVLANETVGSEELLDELRAIGADNATTYHVVVPVSPIETKKPTSSSSLMWKSARDSSELAGCEARSMPMMSAPSVSEPDVISSFMMRSFGWSL